MMSEEIFLLKCVLIFLISTLIHQEILCTYVQWNRWNRWSLSDVTFGTPMEILEGYIPFTMCLMRCHYTPYCASVHVNKASFQCELSSYYPLEKWLPAKTRSGWNVYYMADLVYGTCYWYTERDLSYIAKEPGSFDAMCESYPYHTATHVDLMSGKCYCIQTKGCYVSSSRNYNGTWSRTKSGINCQRWDSQTPHNHQMTSASMFPEDGNITNARFYCRDPDNTGELWCYTVDPSVRREICGIPKCSP